MISCINLQFAIQIFKKIFRDAFIALPPVDARSILRSDGQSIIVQSRTDVIITSDCLTNERDSGTRFQCLANFC